jgi:hypothetical protein
MDSIRGAIEAPPWAGLAAQPTGVPFQLSEGLDSTDIRGSKLL